MRACVLRLAFATTLVGVATWSFNVAAAPEGDEAADAEAPAEAEPPAEKSSTGSASVSATPSATTTSSSGSRSKRKRDRPAPAPMKNRVGFGAIHTIAGLNGLLLRWYAANRFTLGLTAGVGIFSHGDTDENGEFNRIRTVGVVGIGPELFFWPAQGDRSQQLHADFGIGTRVTTYFGFLGNLPEEQTQTLDSPLEIDIEIPAAMQLFIGQRIAVLPEFGVVFRVIPGNREPDQNGEFDMNPGRGIGSARGTTDGPGFGFEVGDHAGLFFGIGFAYFFGQPRT